MKTCIWCGAIAAIGHGPRIRPAWRRFKCKRCGAFGYINDPDPIELSEVYKSAWEENEQNSAFATGSTDTKIARSVLKAVGYPKDNKNHYVCLDYGGGTGKFANVLCQKNATLTVYEPYGKNPGLPETVTWVSSTDDISERSFDWIFMIEVIEHLLEPQITVGNIYHYLKPGGRVVITTPNANGWRARVDKFSWREAQNPTHINLFSAFALIGILQNAGFKNIKRIHRPVTYRKTGIAAMALSATQILGIDGGLRIVAQRCE